jgi:hypothetical protein
VDEVLEKLDDTLGELTGGAPASGMGDIVASFFLSPSKPGKFIWGAAPVLMLEPGGHARTTDSAPVGGRSAYTFRRCLSPNLAGFWLGVEISCRVYRPRRARESPLFRLVEQHLEEFLRVYPERFAKNHGPLRPVVERVLRGFMRCGLVEHGFARLWCPTALVPDVPDERAVPVLLPRKKLLPFVTAWAGPTRRRGGDPRARETSSPSGPTTPGAR